MSVEQVTTQNQYTVVLRAPSWVSFWPEDPPIVATNFPSSVGPIYMEFHSRYVDEGYDAPVPRGLSVTARTRADSIEEAINASLNAAQAIMNVLAFSTNAPIGDPNVDVAYDSTPGHDNREFFQNYLEEETGIPRMSRHVRVDPVAGLLNAFDTGAEKERLLRGVAQYHLALSYWGLGRQTLALAHLYMGMEAISKAALRIECQRKGISGDELMASWGVRLPEQRKSTGLLPAIRSLVFGRPKDANREYIMLSAVRRRLLFRCDEECYKKARQASDEFEHGYREFQHIRGLATEVRNRTAGYLRTAIIDLIGLDAASRDTLLSTPYDSPLQALELRHYIRAHLVGSTDHLAAEGEEHPRFRWHPAIQSMRREDDGRFTVGVNSNAVAAMSPEVVFRPDSHEVWGG